MSLPAKPGRSVSIVESLEERTLFAAPAVKAAVADGVLEVVGGKKADTIVIILSSSDPNTVEVQCGRFARVIGSFNRADFPGGIYLSGGGGNDTLLVNSMMDIPATIVGGPGKDILAGAMGDDVLDGGPGNDTLVGGRGDDSLDGGTGKDKLFGGDGDDVLSGGTGKDAVTGGDGADSFEDDAASEVLDHQPDELLVEASQTAAPKRSL